MITKEEMRHDSYGLVQCCKSVTKFKQAENKASNHMFRKCIFNRCDDSCMGTEIRLMLGRHMIRNAIGRLKASHYFIPEFKATNLSERSKNQTEYDITAITHDSTIFIVVTALNTVIESMHLVKHTNKEGIPTMLL